MNIEIDIRNREALMGKSEIDNEVKKRALILARDAIISKSKKVTLTKDEIDALPPILKENRGGFVSLHIDRKLRGCIGYILPMYPLYQVIIENAYNAAYLDYRFNELTKDEIKKIDIEISVLTIPEEVDYSDYNDLLNKIRPNIDGVIIKEGAKSSTFLPQVWEQLPDKEDFFNNLCLKANLPIDEWKSGNIRVETYQALVFGET